MNTSIKKIASYFLVIMVLVFTILALLGIWDIIDYENIIQKLLTTLIVIFCSAAVILFVFSVLLKEKDN